MAHYTLINSNNLVTAVFVGRDETDLAPGVSDWEAYYAPEGFKVKRTSYNTYGGVHYTDGEPSADQTKAFRFNYAGIGFTYDETLDAFIPPKPLPSLENGIIDYELDPNTCNWIPIMEES